MFLSRAEGVIPVLQSRYYLDSMSQSRHLFHGHVLEGIVARSGEADLEVPRATFTHSTTNLYSSVCYPCHQMLQWPCYTEEWEVGHLTMERYQSPHPALPSMLPWPSFVKTWLQRVGNKPLTERMGCMWREDMLATWMTVALAAHLCECCPLFLQS